MIEKTIEWNLAFSQNEVVNGIEKMLVKLAYPFSYSKAQNDCVFFATPPQGTLSCTIRPLASQQSPFNLQVTLYRTMLTVTYSRFSSQMEESLQRSLTLAFLRVGG